MSEPVDLALGVLDHQLLDAEEYRCGKVDDLELAGIQEGSPRVETILVGAPVWRGRGVFGRLAATFVRSGRTVRVQWEEVAKLDSAVHLKRPAQELGLAAGDRRARRFVAWIPGAQ
jgi:hypothetical protein